MTSPVEEDQLQGLTRHWPGLIAIVRDAEARAQSAEAALADQKAELAELRGDRKELIDAGFQNADHVLAALAALKAEVVEVVGRIADRASDGRRTASLPVIAREARDLLAKLKGGGQ